MELVNGVNSSHTLDTSANYAEAGDKSLQLFGVNTANGSYNAYLTENFSPTISGGINTRFFLFLPTGYESANTNSYRRVLRVFCGNNRGQLSVIGGLIRMEEVGAWGEVQTTTPISENAWHCVEMHIDPPSSSTPMQFWIDGVSAGTLNGAFSGSTVFTSIDFGDVILGAGSGSSSTFYLDELVVANSYIGTTIQSPVTYFSDTFENWTVYGGAWSTVTGINSSHTLNTSTTEAAAGTHSLELTGYDIVGQSSGAYLTKNFSPTITSDIYVRFYLFLPTGFGTANTGCGRRLLHASCGSNRAQISIKGDQPYMEQVGNWSQLLWPSQLSENTWHCLEVHITSPAATTYFEFWVDGVLNSTAMTGNFSASSAWDHIDFGDISLAGGNNGNALYYMDEVIVSNSYIPLLP